MRRSTKTALATTALVLAFIVPVSPFSIANLDYPGAEQHRYDRARLLQTKLAVSGDESGFFHDLIDLMSPTGHAHPVP